MRNAIIFGFTAAVLLAYTAVNVYVSQVHYGPLMFRLMTLDDRDAAREFLANLKGTDVPNYPNLYENQSRYLNSHFDNIFAREVDISRLNTQKALSRYEDLLQLNPHNPQVLLKLSLLHRERGNEDQADEYLRRALEIDPWMGIE